MLCARHFGDAGFENEIIGASSDTLRARAKSPAEIGIAAPYSPPRSLFIDMAMAVGRRSMLPRSFARRVKAAR